MQHSQINFYDLPQPLPLDNETATLTEEYLPLSDQQILLSEFEIPIPFENSSIVIHPNQTKFWKDMSQLFRNSSSIVSWYQQHWNAVHVAPPLAHYWKYIAYVFTGPFFLYFYGTLHSLGEVCCLFLVDRPIQVLYFLKIRGYLFYLQQAQEVYSFWNIVNAIGIVFEMVMILQYLTNRLVMPLVHWYDEFYIKAPWDFFFEKEEFLPLVFRFVFEWVGVYTDDEDEEHARANEDDEEENEDEEFQILENLPAVQANIHRRRRRRVSTKPMKFEKLNQVQLKQLISDLQNQLSEAMQYVHSKLKVATDELSKEEYLVSKECVICLNNVPNVILKPCCHVCLCSECAVKTVHKNRNKDVSVPSTPQQEPLHADDNEEVITQWLQSIPTEEENVFEIPDQDALSHATENSGQLYLRSRLKGRCPICRRRISHFSLLSNENVAKFSNPFLDKTCLVSTTEEYHKHGILRGIQETSTLMSVHPHLFQQKK